MSDTSTATKPQSQVLSVLANQALCSAHKRLTLDAPGLAQTKPGQFIHLGPQHVEIGASSGQEAKNGRQGPWDEPFLRRAFSIGGLTRRGSACHIDLIYHIVGAGTYWMAGLRPGDPVHAIGPLGNRFPEPQPHQTAWLVAGGVGLPPLLWFARTLAQQGQNAIFFLGARSADLVALSVSPRHDEWTAAELPDTPLILATEDGSAGRAGNVVQALANHTQDHPLEACSAVVYTCGPEAMMRAVADFCASRSMRCVVCMERAMACGIGTCQSCVVPLREPADAEGWRYALCCTQGPIFDAQDVIWER